MRRIFCFEKKSLLLSLLLSSFLLMSSSWVWLLFSWTFGQWSLKTTNKFTVYKDWKSCEGLISFLMRYWVKYSSLIRRIPLVHVWFVLFFFFRLTKGYILSLKVLLNFMITISGLTEIKSLCSYLIVIQSLSDSMNKLSSFSFCLKLSISFSTYVK